MHPKDELVPVFKKLRLGGLSQSLDLRTRQAADDSLAYEEFLLRLLNDEVERRDARQLEQRLRRASFDQQRSLEDFDFTFNPKLPKSKIVDLATCGFIRKHQNVALVGQTGVGKSHIAQAIGHRACAAGFTVVYTAAQDFFAQLHTARGDDSLDRRLKNYVAPDLLILDDLGLRTLRNDEPLDLYEVIRQRYDSGFAF